MRSLLLSLALVAGLAAVDTAFAQPGPGGPVVRGQPVDGSAPPRKRWRRPRPPIGVVVGRPTVVRPGLVNGLPPQQGAVRGPAVVRPGGLVNGITVDGAGRASGKAVIKKPPLVNGIPVDRQVVQH